jgi:hypothetical protein
MPLSRLAIYTTAHGLDSVQDHHDQLEAADISPDFIALELPDVDDVNKDIHSFSRKLAKQSPATGFAWYIIERIHIRAYKDTDHTAARGDAEYEAGRQYANQHDIPHIAVDLERSKVAERYATWPRRIRDTTVLLAGGGFALALWAVALYLTLGGLLALFNQGFTQQGILSILLAGIIAAVLMYAGRFSAFYTIGKIGRWFRDTIREVRDDVMYDQTRRIGREHSASEGLLITGAAHFSGIEALAEQDGVECWQIESPAVSRYEGYLDELSPQEMEELAEPDPE